VTSTLSRGDSNDVAAPTLSLVCIISQPPARRRPEDRSPQQLQQPITRRQQPLKEVGMQSVEAGLIRAQRPRQAG
jgi:hypothetical protein